MTTHEQTGAGPATAPVLRSGEVVLRPLAEHDIPALVEQERDPQTQRWTPSEPLFGPEQAQARVRAAREQWAARSATTPRRWAVGLGEGEPGHAPYAGTVEYVPDGQGGAEVGFVVHPARRGRGLAVLGLGLALRHAHTTDRVEVAHWRSEVGNWASRRVAWRLGFRVEGTVRGIAPHPDGPREGWWGTRLAADPQSPAHAWWETPRLESDAVLLRPWEDRDAGRVPGDTALVSAGEEDVRQPAEGPAFTSWLDACRAGAASGSRVTWCVAQADDGPPQGALHLRVSSGARRGSGELGWWMTGDPRTHAAPLLLGGLLAVAGQVLGQGAAHPRTGLAVPRLHRLGATIGVGDADSARALEESGFHRVGVEHATWTGRSHAAPEDTARYELLALP
jgi:RimJ/RimL family protein N-acetyltransferase